MSIATWEFESPPLHFFLLDLLSMFAESFPLAEIAQLVEHNLAKVGVAGPSPVFRSTNVPHSFTEQLLLLYFCFYAIRFYY